MSAYKTLCEKTREIALINDTASALGWDEETYMPRGSVDYRSKQLSWLSGKAHQLKTSDEYRRALEEAEQVNSDDLSQRRTSVSSDMSMTVLLN